MPSPRSGLVVFSLIGVAALAGCGSDASGTADPDASTTSLEIIVTADEDVTPLSYSLTCNPAGGDHPQSKQACEVLDKIGAGIFEPVPNDMACTMMFGGPQTATVRGTYAGKEVDATFKRTNGCEIDRWDKLGTTFFDIPML